jgi:hypothetical protein
VSGSLSAVGYMVSCPFSGLDGRDSANDNELHALLRWAGVCRACAASLVQDLVFKGTVIGLLIAKISQHLFGLQIGFIRDLGLDSDWKNRKFERS